MSREETHELDVPADVGWSRAATALFVVGLATVCANSALYFFGVDSLSHPAISVLGLALLAPLYLKKR
jgi:hypothetical protein